MLPRWVRVGVDLATGAEAVCRVAELAADNEDLEEAKALYRCAWRVWKSPHAKRALAELRQE